MWKIYSHPVNKFIHPPRKVSNIFKNQNYYPFFFLNIFSFLVDVPTVTRHICEIDVYLSTVCYPWLIHNQTCMSHIHTCIYTHRHTTSTHGDGQEGGVVYGIPFRKEVMKIVQDLRLSMRTATSHECRKNDFWWTSLLKQHRSCTFCSRFPSL